MKTQRTILCKSKRQGQKGRQQATLGVGAWDPTLAGDTEDIPPFRPRSGCVSIGQPGVIKT